MLKFLQEFANAVFPSATTYRYSTPHRLIGPDHRPDQSTGSKGPELLIRPLDRALIVTGVFRGCFPWRYNEIATRRPNVWSG